MGVSTGFIFLHNMSFIYFSRIISFLAALGCVCFGTNDIVASSLMIASAWVAFVLIIIWILSTSSEEGPYRDPWIIGKLSNRTSKAIHNEKLEDV